MPLKAKTLRLKPKAPKSIAISTRILLDRSASMSERWGETLTAINRYVSGLKENNVKGDIWLGAFCSDVRQNHLSPFGWGDRPSIIEVLRYENIADWRPIDGATARPYGGTPLYDAIVDTVDRLESERPKKAVVVILTDGEENASHDPLVARARAMIALDRCRLKDWQVVFLGADWDGFAQAKSVGIGYANTMSYGSHNTSAVMEGLSRQTANYSAGGGMRGQSIGGNMAFTPSDRLTATAGTSLPK